MLKRLEISSLALSLALPSISLRISPNLTWKSRRELKKALGSSEMKTSECGSERVAVEEVKGY